MPWYGFDVLWRNTVKTGSTTKGCSPVFGKCTKRARRDQRATGSTFCGDGGVPLPGCSHTTRLRPQPVGLLDHIVNLVINRVPVRPVEDTRRDTTLDQG